MKAAAGASVAAALAGAKEGLSGREILEKLLPKWRGNCYRSMMCKRMVAAARRGESLGDILEEQEREYQKELHRMDKYKPVI